MVKVAELMTADVVTVRGDATLEEAMTCLADSHVSGLAVVDGRKHLVGVLSTTDLLAAEVETGDERARAQILRDTLVQDVMTAPPLTVSPDAEVRAAALEMEYGDVHRLFVELDGELLGVISRSDINRALAKGKM